MDVGNGIWFLGIAVLAHAVAWFFKTPKESASEIAARVAILETSYHGLDVQFAGMNGKLGTQMTTLSENIKELASNVRELTRRMDAHRVGQ
jgi:hypothetical protein